MRKFILRSNEKITAVILVLMLIFSSASAGLTAAAEDESPNYTVSYASPAIPMDANTFVRLDSIEFATQSGAVISGSDATLTLIGESNDVVVSNGVITAYAKGVYAATVTDGTNSMSVYVVVKNPAESTWYLYDEDFTTGYEATAYGQVAVPEGWVAQHTVNTIATTASEFTHLGPYSTTANVTTGIIPIYNAYEESVDTAQSRNGYFTLNNEIVNAFSDYTISAETISYSHFDYQRSAVGLYGRAGLSTDGKLAKFDGDDDRHNIFFANNYGDKTGAAGSDTPGIRTVLITNGFWWNTVTTLATSIEGITHCTVNSNAGQELDMSLKLEGNTATYKAGTTTVTHTVTDGGKAGAVGMFVGEADFRNTGLTTWTALQHFSVALNNSASDKPVSYSLTESDDGIDKYTVDLNRAPAIPMNSGTVVQLKHINFSLGNTIVNGSQINVTSTNDEIIVADGKITALSTGVYPLSVTIDSDTVTAYAVVKDITDDKWYLYNEDFTDDYDEYKVGAESEFPDNWKSQALTTYGYSNGFLEYPYMSYYNAQNVYLDDQSEPMVGANPFTDPYDYGWNNSNTHNARGYFTLTTDVISAFKDFTIYYEGKTWTNFDWNAAGTGLFGRAATQNGLITRNVTNNLVAFSVNNLGTGLVNTVENGATQTVRTQVLDAANPTWSMTQLTTDTGNAWANWNTVSNISGNEKNNGADTKYALKYDGTTATFWNPDDESAGYYSVTVADGKGSVGVFAGCISDGSADTDYSHTWISVDNFAVALNNTSDDMPYYTSISLFETLDTAIVPASGNIGSGLVFNSLIYIGREVGGTAVGDTAVTVNGTQYNVAGYGTLLVPNALLGENELVHGSLSDIIDTPVTSYASKTDDYMNLSVAVTNIPENYKTLDISVRSYIKYQITEEQYGYIYGEANTTNYYNVQREISGIYPLDVINPDFDAEDFSTFDITYDSMTNQGVWQTPDGMFDAEAAALKSEIHSYADTLKNTSGTKYYVDPSASINGSGSESSPFNSLSSAVSSVSSGATILIKRGTVVRGEYTLPNGVSLGAYGDTSLPKPVIMGSDKNYADLSWSETATENVYSVACSHDNVGNVVFNYGQAIGRFRDSVAELENNFDYYADGSNLYVYSNVGNPAEICQSIEVSYKGDRAILVINSNCTLENLQIMFGGAHGIQANDTAGVTIRGCEVGFMGGAATGTAGVYYGNGIEFWNGTTDATIDSCYVFQCYDSAVTHQFTDQTGDTTANFDNITYSNNLIEYNYMGFEYFNTTSDTSDSMTDISFDGNIVRFSGYGFGWYSRPASDREVGSNIKGIGPTDNMANNFTVTNNYLDKARQGLIIVNSTDNNAYIPDFSGNHYAVGTKDCILRTATRVGYRAYSADYQINDALSLLGETTGTLYY